MIWRSKRNADGRVIKRVWVREEGYQITRFTLDGVDSYRCYLAGQALGAFQPSPEEAKALCARHFEITGGRPD